MISPIFLYGSTSLSTKAKRIPYTHEEYEASVTTGKIHEFDDIKQFIRDMHETMINANGIGLSANQVGSDLSIFVVDAQGIMSESNENEYPMTEPPASTYINPEIIEYIGEDVVAVEGCLSFPPTIKIPVERAESIRMRYMDMDMKTHEIVAQGLYATVLQHEYDHLQGTTFVQYLSGFYAQRLRTELKRFARGQYEFDFPYETIRHKKR